MRFALAAALAAALALTASATAGTASKDGLLRVTGRGRGRSRPSRGRATAIPRGSRAIRRRQAARRRQVRRQLGRDGHRHALGGGGYDVVSASGDASNRLIASKRVAPIDISQIPDWKNFLGALKSPPQQHGRWQALRRLLASGARTCSSGTRPSDDGADARGPRSTRRPTPARSPCRTTRSRSPTRRST